jgi:2-dehydropantoate 2-reductase
MRVLVMAAGAVGGYFGALLAGSGNRVTFVARGENLAAIRDGGLRVESVTSGDFVVEGVDATDRLDGSWSADLVLFCVKGYQNEVAIEAMRPAVGVNTTILTVQNGLGSGDRLSDAFGVGAVLLGAAYVEAQRRAPGRFAELGGTCRIVFGEPDGARSPRAVNVLETLHGAGIAAELTADPTSVLWNKLVFICALSGMTSICRASFSEVMAAPGTVDLTRRVVEEAASVARAVGVGLAPEVAGQTMDQLIRDKEELVSSMHGDLMAGRPLELDNLNGAVSSLGRQHGVATPVNDYITACLTVSHRRAVDAVGRQ